MVFVPRTDTLIAAAFVCATLWLVDRGAQDFAYTRWVADTGGVRSPEPFGKRFTDLIDSVGKVIGDRPRWTVVIAQPSRGLSDCDPVLATLFPFDEGSRVAIVQVESTDSTKFRVYCVRTAQGPRVSAPKIESRRSGTLVPALDTGYVLLAEDGQVVYGELDVDRMAHLRQVIAFLDRARSAADSSRMRREGDFR